MNREDLHVARASTGDADILQRLAAVPLTFRIDQAPADELTKALPARKTDRRRDDGPREQRPKDGWRHPATPEEPSECDAEIRVETKRHDGRAHERTSDPPSRFRSPRNEKERQEGTG